MEEVNERNSRKIFSAFEINYGFKKISNLSFINIFVLIDGIMIFEPLIIAPNLNVSGISLIL